MAFRTGDGLEVNGILVVDAGGNIQSVPSVAINEAKSAMDATNLKLEVNGNASIRGANGLFFGITTNNYNSWKTKIWNNNTSTMYVNAQEFNVNNAGYGSLTFLKASASGVDGTTFRDLDNTGFYVNPLSSSKLYGSLMLGHTDSQAGSLVIYDTGNNALEIKGNGSNSFLFDMIGTGSTGSLKINDLNVGIGADADTGHRLKVSTSGHNYLWIESTAGNNEAMTRYKNPTSNNWYTGLRNGTSNSLTDTSYHVYSSAFGATTGGWNASGQFFTTNEGYAGGSFRAPIFYDRGDTAYYIYGSSSSRLNQLRANKIQAGTISALSSEGNLAVYDSGNPFISFHTGTARTAYIQELSGRFYFGEVPYTESVGSFRAPVFYDSNDSNYYLDASSAGTSLNVAGNAIIPGYASIAGVELSGGDTRSLSGMANNQWVTVANFTGSRKADIIEVYDNESSRHNYLKMEVSWSYGQGSIQIINGVRHGTHTIQYVRLLYNAADRTYGTGKLQVYLGNWNTAYSLRIKQLGFGRTGWGRATIPSTVEAGLPSGNTIMEDTTMQCIESAKGSFGSTGRIGTVGGIDLFDGSPIKFHTTSGDGTATERGFIDAQEGGHLRIATSGGEKIVFQDGGVGGTTNLTILGSGEMVKEATERFTIKSHTNSWDGGLRFYASNNSTIFQMHPDTNGQMYVDREWRFQDSQINYGPIRRGNHHVGHLEGSYNNIGGNGSKSNPIYTIGSSYNPDSNGTTLANMYGIGYTNVAASFISGSLQHGDWGMYVAAGGAARVFLDGNYGHGAFLGSIRASSFYDVDSTSYYLDPGVGTTALYTNGAWRQTSTNWTGEVPGKMQYHSNNWYLQATSNFIFRNASGVNVLETESNGRTTLAEDLRLSSGANLTRLAHHSGHLEGSYNNVGSNGTKSNPIYTIGSSYNPSDAALGDMYGIGFTDSSAGFITGGLANGSWGLYVAGDGDARIFLEGNHGHGGFVGDVRANRFVDINSTGYYVHPGDTTISGKFRQTVIIGDGTQLNSNDGSWGARLNLTDSVHSKIEIGQDANSIKSHWNVHTGHDNAKFGTSTNHHLELQTSGTTRFKLDKDGGTTNTGNLVVTGDVQSNRYDEQGGTFLFKTGSGSGRTRHLNLADTGADPASVTDSNNPTGISWGTRSDNNGYYMLGLKGSYSNGLSTHSRLAVGWHTGVEIGGSPTYGGTRFFSDSPFVTTNEIMSVGKGDSHVRVVNNLYAKAFYDIDSSSYYLNPASTSFLDSISVKVGAENTGGANSSLVGLIMRYGGSSYNNNTWAHKFHKMDHGGGVPLYLSETIGTGSWQAVQRWGSYSGNSFKSQIFGTLKVDTNIHTPIIYDPDNSQYMMDLSTNNNSLVMRGTIHVGPEGNLGLGHITHPKRVIPGAAAAWAGSGTTTGQVVIDLPGTLSNYDMLYFEVDVYEYSAKNATKIIVGGHNWNSGGNGSTGNLMWHNVGVKVIGDMDKSIYFGWRNNGSVNKRVMVIGSPSSSWSYGTVRVSSVSGADDFYVGSIDYTGDWAVTQSTSSSYYTKSPTTDFNSTGEKTLKTHGRMQAYGYQGNGNVGGTGEASWHPSGIYSNGTNWLYGAIHMNNNTINSCRSIAVGADNSESHILRRNNANNTEIRTHASAASGLLVRNGSDQFRFQVYGDGSHYGFLDAVWGSWDLKKTTNGAFHVDEGSGLKRVLNEANWSSYITIPTSLPANGGNADTVDGIHASGFIQSGGAWNASNMPGSRHVGIAVNGGEVVFQRDNPNNGQMSVLVDGNYYAGENNGFWSLYSGNNYNNKVGFKSNSSGNLEFTSAGTESKFTTAHGFIQLGPMNSSYAHIYTDRGSFYFNKTDLYAAGNLMWTAGNDGSGSGLDADTLDGTHLASIYSNSAVANASVNKLYENATITYGASYLQWTDNNGTGGAGTNGAAPGNPFSDWHYHIIQNHANSGGYYFDIASCFHSDRIHFRRNTNGNLSGWNELWHTGNDGSGSGLDADTCDGQHLGTSAAVQFGSVEYYNGTSSNIKAIVAGTGDSSAKMYWKKAGTTNLLTLDMSGNLTATGNVTAYSDRRIKENITPITEALSKVQSLTGNTYTRNDQEDTVTRYAGLIAQEVEQVLPEAVREADDGIKTLDYNATIALLVESIKELKSEVDDLKTQLENK